MKINPCLLWPIGLMLICGILLSGKPALAVYPGGDISAGGQGTGANRDGRQRLLYVEGEVLVTFNSDDPTGLDRALDRLPVAVHKRFRHLSGKRGGAFVLLRSNRHERGDQAGRPLKTTAQLMAELSQNPDVAAVSPNYYRYKAAMPDDPHMDLLWGLHNTGQTGGTVDADIDGPEAWDIQTGSASVILASIDTGVDYTHADLAGNMWVNPGEIPDNGVDDDGNGYIDDIHGIDTGEDDADPMDADGHGTHTAGTMAAVGDNGIGGVGVCWNASIMAVKAADGQGDLKDSDLIEGIDYVTMMKAQAGHNIVAINASWGGNAYNPLLRDAIADAGDAGIVFVAAAGSQGYNNDEWPNYPSCHDLWNIVSVAGCSDHDSVGSFSNYGSLSVDLAAPGEDIWSTVPAGGYDTKTGSSMAAPHVTGAAGLISLDPLIGDLPARAASQQIIARLLAGVDEKSFLISEVATRGRLNVHNALLLGAVPFVETISPAYGVRAGSIMTLTGMNFGDLPGAVLSAPDSCEVISWANERIQFRMPATAIYYTRRFQVRNANDQVSNTVVATVRQRWNDGDALPFSTEYGGMVEYMGRLYAVQGGFYDSYTEGKVAVYDPVSGVWQVIGTMPDPVIVRPCDVALGRNGSGDPVIDVFSNHFDDAQGIYRFNLTTQTWTALSFPAGFPQEGLLKFDIVSMLNHTGENVCYLSGGSDAALQEHDTLWEYHPDTQSMIPLGEYSLTEYNGIYQHTSYYVDRIGADGAVCVVGGYGGDNRSTQCYDRFSGLFNAPNTDLPQLPDTLTGAADLQADGRLWVLGGRYDGDLTHRTFYLDPDATSWSEGPSLLYPVQHAQAASIEGTLYLVGGEYYGDPTWFTQVLVPRLPAGDTDNDGDIDGADLARFAVVFDNRIDPDADLNEDRSIDAGDVGAFADNFGK